MPYDFCFSFIHTIEEPDLLDARISFAIISLVHCSLKESIRSVADVFGIKIDINDFMDNGHLNVFSL